MIRSAKTSLFALVGAIAAGLALAAGAEQRQANSSNNDRLEQNFLAEHEVGRHFQVTPSDLPPPKTGPVVTNRPLTVPFNGQSLQVPPGSP